MATATTLPAVQRQGSSGRGWTRQAYLPVLVALATATAFLLLGYHPYAEDGGIYAAALAARLDPSLFPAEHAFAVAHTGRSLFVPLMAALAGVLHLSLPSVLVAAYVACLAATVVAAQSLAQVLFASVSSQRWAVATLVISLGVPVAGTSLYLFDPYLTARSISTPLLLWAFSLLLRRRSRATAGCLLIAFGLHPMMTATSAVLFGFALALRSSRRALWVAGLAAGVVIAMAMLRFVPSPDGEAVRAASISRSYWFLSKWAWYEVIGLLAPLLLLPAIAFSVLPRRAEAKQVPRLHSPSLRSAQDDEVLQPQARAGAARELALAATIATATVCAGMLLFVRPDNGSMLLARLQPLRLLHTVYLVFVLLLGGLAGRIRLLPKVRLGWAICAVGAFSLFSMQRTLYPNDRHVELSWRASPNGYQQAFLWARDHTPKNTLFALDAGYTTARGEDAQLFRALALRSSLPDAAKDGGIASVMPRLAPDWQIAADAQAGLASASDEECVARVRPLGATWIVLPSSAATHFVCPYVNRTAKVCRLP